MKTITLTNEQAKRLSGLLTAYATQERYAWQSLNGTSGADNKDAEHSRKNEELLVDVVARLIIEDTGEHSQEWLDGYTCGKRAMTDKVLTAIR